MSLENDLLISAFEQTGFWNLATRSGRITSTNSGNIQLRSFLTSIHSRKKGPCEAKLCWSAAEMMTQSSKGQFYN